jgi:hypothetical protein
MRELLPVVETPGGSGSHDNGIPSFENVRDQLHHIPMVLLACNLLVH